MTHVQSQENIVEEFRYLKEIDAVPKELLHDVSILLMPKEFPLIIGLLSLSYLVFSGWSLLGGDISSSIAALGPMATSAYITYLLKRRLSR